MTVDQMRFEIIKVYPTSDSWKKKVHKMYDDQVIAIYYDFLKKGKFNTVDKKFRIPEKESIFKNPYKNYQTKQMNMFELLKGERKVKEVTKMNEFEARDYILEKGRSIKTIEELTALIQEVNENFNYDYGVAPRVIGAVSTVVAWYLSKTMGISGYQAGFVMWDFIQAYNYPYNKCGMRLVDFDNMLYPQYDYKFEKTISDATWKLLQKTAAKKLEEAPDAHPIIIAHWKSIVDGKIPFGYIVKEY